MIPLNLELDSQSIAISDIPKLNERSKNPWKRWKTYSHVRWNRGGLGNPAVAVGLGPSLTLQKPLLYPFLKQHI